MMMREMKYIGWEDERKEMKENIERINRYVEDVREVVEEEGISS